MALTRKVRGMNSESCRCRYPAQRDLANRSEAQTHTHTQIYIYIYIYIIHTHRETDTNKTHSNRLLSARPAEHAQSYLPYAKSRLGLSRTMPVSLDRKTGDDTSMADSVIIARF